MAFVSRLFKPVRIHALFAAREYALGDMVEMVVQIVTRDRLEIVAGHAELIWTPKGRGAVDLRREMGAGPFVHSSVQFLQRHVIRMGGEENFSVDLRTETDPPAGGIVDANWKITISVESATREMFTLDNKIKISPHWLVGSDDLRMR